MLGAVPATDVATNSLVCNWFVELVMIIPRVIAQLPVVAVPTVNG